LQKKVEAKFKSTRALRGMQHRAISREHPHNMWVACAVVTPTKV
jgi:hypothetical protein